MFNMQIICIKPYYSKYLNMVFPNVVVQGKRREMRSRLGTQVALLYLKF